MNALSLTLGVARGLAGAMSMTGYRTLASELGLMDQGTPPERMADEAIPSLMALVPEEMRPGVVDVLHLSYGVFGGAVFSVLPKHWRAHWASGPLFGIALWFGYNAGLVPLFGLHADRPRQLHEIAMLAGDHVLYGAIVGNSGHLIVRRFNQRATTCDQADS